MHDTDKMHRLQKKMIENNLTKKIEPGIQDNNLY